MSVLRKQIKNPLTTFNDLIAERSVLQQIHYHFYNFGKLYVTQKVVVNFFGLYDKN